MSNFKFFVALLTVAAFEADAIQQLIAPKINGGAPADTLRRFPHHVIIRQITTMVWDQPKPCAGSILNEQWILSAAFCVSTTDSLEIQFERLYVNNPTGSYSVVVNSDAIHFYPVPSDDIALVKLPFRLVFSDLIKQVSISALSLAQLENKLTVFPGFDTNMALSNSSGTSTEEQLKYVMLNVISNAKCQEYYGSSLDEYLQFCTADNNTNRDMPCYTDYGGGLLYGWPARTELVGIYLGYAFNCVDGSPPLYVYVAKYASWINSLING